MVLHIRRSSSAREQLTGMRMNITVCGHEMNALSSSSVMLSPFSVAELKHGALFA